MKDNSPPPHPFPKIQKYFSSIFDTAAVSRLCLCRDNSQPHPLAQTTVEFKRKREKASQFIRRTCKSDALWFDHLLEPKGTPTDRRSHQLFLPLPSCFLWEKEKWGVAQWSLRKNKRPNETCWIRLWESISHWRLVWFLSELYKVLSLLAHFYSWLAVNTTSTDPWMGAGNCQPSTMQLPH